MIDTSLVLIAPAARYQDENGIWHVEAAARREIFARQDSISRSEFHAAGQDGLRPEYRFTVFACEYNDEPECEHNGQRYAIYRTYHVPGTDDMELYVQRKAGLKNGQL